MFPSYAESRPKTKNKKKWCECEIETVWGGKGREGER
jgi:hypothetical protein